MSVRSMQVQLPEAPSLPQECGLCLESPRRSLPCSHSFCLPCLQHILQKQPRSSSFPCPTCRSPTDIPPRGMESIHSGFNWALNSPTHRPSHCCNRFPNTSPTSGPAPTYTKVESHEEEEKKRRVAGVPQVAAVPQVGAAVPQVGAAVPQVAAAVPQERRCASHPEELLRFYCLPCRRPICRDCKLTGHEKHPATSLEERAAELRTLLSLMMQMSGASLEPKLRQILRKAEHHHQKTLKEEREEMVKRMQRRAEELKKEIDQALLKATQETEEMAVRVQTGVGRCLEAMTQGLGAFLSFSDHAEDTVRGGCKADVVDLLPRVSKFFREACQQAPESFEFLEPDDPGALPGENYSLVKDGALRSFLTDDWRVRLELSENASTKECPFCSFRYHDKAITCPLCCQGKPKTAPAPTPAASATKTFFGFRSKKPVSSNSVDSPQLKCQACCRSYDATCDFCPHCGMPSSSCDTLTTVKTLVSRYIGHVSSKEHQSGGAEAGGERSPSGSRSRSRSGSPSWKGDVGGSEAGVASRPCPGAGPEAWEVYNTVCTISTLLQEGR